MSKRLGYTIQNAGGDFTTSTISNLLATNVTSATLLASNGITTGNINFTGNLYQNGQTYISSQWFSGTGGNLSYTNGNVGIATTAPQFNLHVVGSSYISAGITTGNINFTGSLFQNGQPYVGSQWLSGTGGNLSYTNGNVGIGNTAPSANLHVNGSAIISTGLTTASAQISNLNATEATVGGALSVLGGFSAINASATIWALAATSQITTGSLFSTHSSTGTARVTTSLAAVGNSNTVGSIFTNGGNVGIGTTAPSATLHVNGNIGIVYGNGLTVPGQTYTDLMKVMWTGSVDQVRLYTPGAYSGTPKMTLQGDGYVGIGTTAPSYALQVAGDVYATGDVISFSDARLKTSVETIDNALDKIEKLRGVYYTHVQTQKRGVGLIAQEAQQVIPEVVIDKGEDTYLGVAYGNIVGMLVQAIKELSEKVQNLEKQLK